MALIWGTGFDYLGASDAADFGVREFVDQYASAGYITRGTGRYSGYAIEFPTLGSISRWVDLVMPQSLTTVVMGFAFYVGSGTMSDNMPIVQWFDDSNVIQFTLNVNGTAGTFSLHRGDGSSGANQLCITGSGYMPSSGWVYVEIKVVVSDASGTVEIWIDGTSRASASSVDTKASSTTANVYRVRIGTIAGGTRPLTRFDDMYVLDSGSPLGPVYWQYIPPNADTSDASSTPSTGANRYAVIDETTGGDVTDYVEFSGTGMDLYNHAGLSDNPTNIHAVQVVTGLAKVQAGPRTWRPRIKSGGNYGNGMTQGYGGGSATFEFTLFTTDPLTSAAWVRSGVNALKFGTEIVS